MKIVSTPKLPAANGHYSTCIEHGGLLYLSGQLPFDPETREMPEGIEAQTEQTLRNIDLVLREAGSSRDKVLQMRLYIPRIEMWDAVNQVYSEFFADHKPARCVVPTRELHFGALVEIEATACL